MFVKENTLSAIKDYFFDSLEEFYANREVDSFFNLLTNHFLSLSRMEAHSLKTKKLSESELLKFYYAIKELKLFRPIQQIIGSQFFYNNDFLVSQDTLIPRPETEELVDLIVKENKDFSGRLLDIGTGTGAIGISLSLALPSASVSAFDISKAALEIANKNNSQLESSVELLHQDILNPTYDGLPFEIVVSNPPYVLNKEKAEMAENVLSYEPHLALFVEDKAPLLFYKKIATFCQSNLVEGGKLYVEINEKYGPETKELLVEYGFGNVQIIEDLNGKERIVSGIKSNV
jgi:release factor glutamine methyltransferase